MFGFEDGVDDLFHLEALVEDHFGVDVGLAFVEFGTVVLEEEFYVFFVELLFPFGYFGFGPFSFEVFVYVVYYAIFTLYT